MPSSLILGMTGAEAVAEVSSKRGAAVHEQCDATIFYFSEALQSQPLAAAGTTTPPQRRL
jgi:hypothetical protein